MEKEAKQVFEITSIKQLMTKATEKSKSRPMKLITFRATPFGNSTRTYVVEGYKNYRNWAEAIRMGKGTVLGNLKMKNGLVNADSKPVVLAKAK